MYGSIRHLDMPWHICPAAIHQIRWMKLLSVAAVAFLAESCSWHHAAPSCTDGFNVLTDLFSRIAER